MHYKTISMILGQPVSPCVRTALPCPASWSRAAGRKGSVLQGKRRTCRVCRTSETARDAALSEIYSDTMQKRMGDAKLVYRHEDGMNYTRILDDLIVGSCPQTPADCRRLAAQEGVTVILSLQEDTDMAYFGLDLEPILLACPEAGITHLRCPIRDFDGHSLRLRLPTAVAALRRALANASKPRQTAYIHCTAGLGRAPAVALAYMWWIQGTPLPRAREALTSKRPCSPRIHAIRAAALDILQGRKARHVSLGLAGAGLASSVEVAGLDIGWGNRLELKRTSSRWELERDLLPGSYPYKFVMDGRWTMSADHPRGFDGTNWNNVLQVRGWETTPEEVGVRTRVLSEQGDLTSSEHDVIRSYLEELLPELDEHAPWPSIQKY